MLPDGIRRLFRLGRAKDVEAEVDAELAFHLETKTQALIASGMTVEAARVEALRQFGDLREARRTLVQTDYGEATHSARREWLGDWWSDARLAARSLRRTPGLTVTVVVLLALGIGLNAAILGILDRLLLRAPPYLADPDRIVVPVVNMHRGGSPDYSRTMFAYADVTDYGPNSSVFSAVAGYDSPRSAPLGDDETASVRRCIVTGRYFEVLGSRPILGRVLDPSDASGPPVAVISYGLWHRRFGASASALGEPVVVAHTRYTVVGVMPRGFSGAEVNAADVWTLAEHGGLRGDWRTQRHTWMLVIIARLRAGATHAEAVAEITRARREPAAEELRWGVTESVGLASVIPGRRFSFDQGGVRLGVAVAVVAALLLLVAVANVTNLLLARAVARWREFAVRAALGAGRGRLLRHVVIESMLLALVGGLAAGAVGSAAGHSLRTLLLPNYTWALPAVGLLPGAFAACLALAIGVGAGLIPGLTAGSYKALGALRAGVQPGRGSRGRLRSSLVALQLSLSVVLLTGTGLFVRSLIRAGTEDYGLALREMVLATVGLDGNEASRSAKIAELVADLSRVPGVAGATVSSSAPFYRMEFRTVRREEGGDSTSAMRSVIPTDFFAVGGLRMLSGHGFTRLDTRGSERVAVVDSVLAATLWRGRDALGSCLRIEEQASCARVVGVAAHVRENGLDDVAESQFYLAMAQTAVPDEYTILLRATGDPALILEPVRRAIVRDVPGAAHSNVQSYAETLDSQMRPWRVGVILFSASAGLALLLSSIGAYAVMAFAVRQRTHEFGIRRALGAQAHDILRLVVEEGVAVGAIGTLLGLLAATAAGRFVLPLLYRVNPHDPLVMGAAAACLLAATLTAAFAAGVLALRADPGQALQAE